MNSVQVQQIPTSNQTYSLRQFSIEWETLAKKASRLSDKIFKVPESERKNFEKDLDAVNFDQMNLARRSKQLTPQELKTAGPMTEAMEKALRVLDDTLYQPAGSTNDTFSKVIIQGFCKGAVSGGIGMTLGKIVEIGAPQILPAMETYAEYQERLMLNIMACRHNGDENSIADILEHIGNAEFGAAIRDVFETEIVRDALETIGEGILREE